MKGSALGNWVTGLLVAGLLIGAVLMGFVETKTALDGQPAPQFELTLFTGGQISSEQLKGKVVMLDFWATWCPPCIEEMPWLVKVAKEYESRGVAFVAVSHDDGDTAVEDVTRFIARDVPDLKPYVAYGDPATGARFKVRALPTIFILDKKGQITGSQTGQVSERKVRAWLDEALAAP